MVQNSVLHVLSPFFPIRPQEIKFVESHNVRSLNECRIVHSQFLPDHEIVLKGILLTQIHHVQDSAGSPQMPEELSPEAFAFVSVLNESRQVS
mmetsp:Transcript_45505/g.87016  ORF Transcript_45505/g.87016 Transcript_45505/m.87016 type:complete len:93 (-) Transcript_45505:198-476(-)